MENLVPLGTGNSRLMKSNIPASTTLAQLIQMLNNGTFPYDIGPLNSAGISQQGTPLNKATLFSDQTMAKYPSGIEDPDGALNKLSEAAFVGTDGLVDINGDEVGTRVYTGSYTGTGTYGSSNPNTLTFPFEPKILVVGNYWQFTAPYGCPSAPCMGSGNSVGGVNLNWSGNSVSWHSTRNDTQQLNESGKTYYYLAIG